MEATIDREVKMEQVASIEDLAGFLINVFCRPTLASTFYFVLPIGKSLMEQRA